MVIEIDCSPLRRYLDYICELMDQPDKTTEYIHNVASSAIKLCINMVYPFDTRTCRVLLKEEFQYYCGCSEDAIAVLDNTVPSEYISEVTKSVLNVLYNYVQCMNPFMVEVLDGRQCFSQAISDGAICTLHHDSYSGLFKMYFDDPDEIKTSLFN